MDAQEQEPQEAPQPAELMTLEEKAALRGQLMRLFVLLEDAGPLEVAAARSRLLALAESLDC